MNPFNIRQPQDRRKVYNEYLATLQMQIDNLARTEKAVAALKATGAPPVQPTDTRTLSEKLLDIDSQKKVLRQALLEITDGAEAGKIMNTISDEDVVFLGVAFGDFSRMIKQKFAAGIPAPLFNEVLQRYKRDYINSLSVQKGISTGHTTEELLLSIRELLRLSPTAAQLGDLRVAIENIPAGVVPERMRTAGLTAAADLSALIPSASTVAAIDRLNPIDRASAEKALNDGLSSITTGAVLQDLTGKLQRASAKEAPDILSSIINNIILTRDDKIQLEQAKAIAELKKAEYQAKEQEKAGKEVVERRRNISVATKFEELPSETSIEPTPAKAKAVSVQVAEDTTFIDDAGTSIGDIAKLTAPRLRAYLVQKLREGLVPTSKTEINKLKKDDLVSLVDALKTGQFIGAPSVEPPKKEKGSAKKAKKAASTSVFIQEEYDPSMNTATFEAKDYADKRSILEDAVAKRIINTYFSLNNAKQVEEILNRNDLADERILVDIYRDLRGLRGFTGEGIKSKKAKKGERITFGSGLARAMKPTMMVVPDNIDIERGIKKEPSYIPIGKYVVNKHKLRDNVLLMRTVKGGQIAELPQMSISPKLGKMLNNIIHGRGFPSHDDLSNLEDSDKDIMYKVFKMSKAEGIDAIPRPNKSKDEAEFNRFTILKGQILAGNNSKELIKEFKTLLVKLIHGGKILRKEGHDLLIDLASLGY